MKRSVYFFLMCMFAALAVGCGDDDDGGKNAGNNGGGSSANMGVNNTTDVAVEGEFDSTTGTITIYDFQTVFTDPQYGNFEVMLYNSEESSYSSRPLEFTYYSDEGYYCTPIYGLFCNTGGFYPYVTYMKKNSSSASARSQGRQPQTRQKKQLGKPKPLRR